MQQDGKHQHRKTLDGSIPPTPSQSQSDSNSSKRRTQYYEDSLAYKGHSQSTKERIQKDSPVIAELRTNVIIKDEFTVVTNLSQHLSERYRRPESSILITVTHSACLMMGGSFEPAYILTITAIPSEVQPVTNKRNAYLMQHFVADTLHVSSSRGVVRFMEIPEERLATNGSTIAGDIERTESNGVSRSMTNKSSRKSLIPSKRKSLLGRKISDELERKSSTKSTKSLKSLKSVKGKTSPPVPLQPAADLRSSLTNGSARDSSPAPVARGESPANHGSIDHTNTKTVASPLNSPSRPTTANRPGSSRMHLSNTSGNAQDFPAPPPVPETDRVPKISKRKSIIAMFKRGESAKSS
ncbi:Tautomerase/MIF [Tothia fuscella]|uniref:L-dopachrome isomerase n=1 Tax=Tothia fuscella TaxID=1048955 RepID=A0A9P4U035_9PEZI|nr:Tautomerase/MIF [Tothia fuscella]